MTFNEYQEFVKSRIQYDYVENVFGLAGECGEVFEVLKRFERVSYKYNHEEISLNQYKEEIKLLDSQLQFELGDLLWYLTAICQRYGFNLQSIAELNKLKLEQRDNVG